MAKSNVGHPFKEETSVNTNPGLVAAVIKELRKAKPKEIILAEASARGCDTLVGNSEPGKIEIRDCEVSP